jgi:hypothetical protein
VPPLDEVGIDSLVLMVVEPEARESLIQLSVAEWQCLEAQLGVHGIKIHRFPTGGRSLGSWVERENFKFTLSMAESANQMSHGRHHNSYVASRAEVRQIARHLRQACARAGIYFDPRWLKILRLDLFVDALLRASGCGYFDLLRLVSRGARLTGSVLHPNGIMGFGKSYCWAFYGKGQYLLDEADGRDARQALLGERSREAWEQLFRLEMRWYRAASVRCAFGIGTETECDEDGFIAEDFGENSEVGTEDEMEANQPGICLGDLLDRWNELPEIFSKTVRRRCLPKSASEVAKGVTAAHKRHNDPKRRSARPACSVERFAGSMSARALAQGVVLDAAQMDQWPTFDAPLPAGHKNWLLFSPLYLLRSYLKECGLSAEAISKEAARYRRALLEREVCRGSDLFERYRELEETYILGVVSDAESDVEQAAAHKSPIPQSMTHKPASSAAAEVTRTTSMTALQRGVASAATSRGSCRHRRDGGPLRVRQSIREGRAVNEKPMEVGPRRRRWVSSDRSASTNRLTRATTRIPRRSSQTTSFAASPVSVLSAQQVARAASLRGPNSRRRRVRSIGPQQPRSRRQLRRAKLQLRPPPIRAPIRGDTVLGDTVFEAIRTRSTPQFGSSGHGCLRLATTPCNATLSADNSGQNRLEAPRQRSQRRVGRPGTSTPFCAGLRDEIRPESAD